MRDGLNGRHPPETGGRGWRSAVTPHHLRRSRKVELCDRIAYSRGGIQPMADPTTTEAEEVVREGIALWEGDFSKLDLVADSVEVYHPAIPDTELQGRDNFEAFLRSISTAYPDFDVTIDDLVAADDVVMIEWTATGTHEGEFQDIPPTGREVTFTGMGKTRVVDGTMEDIRTYYNRQEVFEQLGLTDE